MKKIEYLESAQNPRVKLWLSLAEPRAIRKAGRFLLAGRKTVPEALARWPERFETIVTADEAALDGLDVPESIARCHVPKAIFERLDVAGTGFPLLVGMVPEMPKADLPAAPRGLELVCALSDPNNLGALIRSAVAFGVARLILMPECAHPFHPRSLRAAANAVFELQLETASGWDALRHSPGAVFALDGKGADMTDFEWPADVRLVLGEEGRGLPAGLDLACLAIPTTGKVESLNAMAAASIALFHHYQSHLTRDR